jgi:hypothetical protein
LIQVSCNVFFTAMKDQKVQDVASYVASFILLLNQ